MAKHLTPEDREKMIARYAVLANASQVAREFEVDEKTVRRVTGASAPKKADLHAQATARGIREGRRALTESVRVSSAWIDELAGNPKKPGCEPGDLSRLISAQRQAVGGLCEVEARIEQRRLSRLTRELRRKEIELAALKIAAGGVERHEVAVVSPELAAAAAREVFGSPSALETNGPARDTSAAPLEVDALPLPSPVDHRAK